MAGTPIDMLLYDFSLALSILEDRYGCGGRQDPVVLSVLIDCPPRITRYEETLINGNLGIFWMQGGQPRDVVRAGSGVERGVVFQVSADKFRGMVPGLSRLSLSGNITLFDSEDGRISHGALCDWGR